MATEARVRSLEDLEAFRSSLIVYLTKARQNVNQVGEEIKRTRTWLMNDQRVYWTDQLRKRSRMLDQANAEMMSARLSVFKENLNLQQQAVRKAKTAVEQAQQKLESVKRWSRDFDRFADPLTRKLESLRHFLEHVLPEGVSQIGQLHRLLESYAGTGSPFGSPPPAATPAEPVADEKTAPA
jgi:hypothetical protein